MADPLSVTGSAVGIVSLGLAATKALVDFYTTARDQKSNTTNTARKLSCLLDLLKIIDSQITDRTFRPNERDLRDAIESSIQGCDGLVRKLEAENENFRDRSMHTVSAAVRRVKYPFSEGTLKKLEEDVDATISHLQLALQALQQHDSNNAKLLLDLVRAEQISSAIRDWLKAPDASVEYNAACKKRHPSTELWLVKGSSFLSWLENPNSFLWLNGFAGCGKSVLCSTAIQYAFRHRRGSSRIAIGFFFFVFDDKSKQDASGMLRALILQLSTQLKDAGPLSRLHDSYQNSTPPDHVLADYLRQLIRMFDHVYILLDALDESPRDKHRGGVLQVLVELRKWSEPGIHLLVTSRNEIDIRDALRDELGASDDDILPMKNESVDPDIAAFVSQHLRDNRKLRKWKDHHHQFEAVFADRAEGVVNREYWFSIDGYTEINLELIEVEPLSCWDRDRALVKSTVNRDTDTAHQTFVRLRHAEVSRDFLIVLDVRERESCLDAQLHLMTCHKNTSLEMVAELFRYLAQSVCGKVHACSGMLNLRLDLSSVVGRPMSVIRIEATPNPSGDSVDITLELVQWACENGNEAVVRRLLATNEVNLNSKIDDTSTPLHIVSRYGHEAIARVLLDRGATIGARDKDGSTPLHVVSRYGHEAVARLLLDRGAAVEAKTQHGWTSLHVASRNGHEAIARLLLDRGAATEANTQRGWTSLHMASRNGHAAIARLLLDRGAAIGARDEDGSTPLHVVSRYGHEAVARLLLDRGAAVEAKTQHGWTSLHVASRNGHEAIARLLLDRGAATEANTQRGWTSLHVASRNGHEAIARLLLDRGAPIGARDEHGSTPFHVASRYSHASVTRLLLDRGVATKGIAEERRPSGNIIHQQASQVVHRNAFGLAKSIPSRADGETDNDIGLEMREEVLNQYLAKMRQEHISTLQALPKGGLEDGDSSSDDESQMGINGEDSRTEEAIQTEEETFRGDIDEVKSFILNGLPFGNLVRRLGEFVTPQRKEQSEMCSEINKDHIEQDTTGKLTQDLQTFGVFSTLLHVAALTWQAIPSAFKEPVVPSGKVRARWTCACGLKLFDDFTELEEGAVVALEKQIQQESASLQDSPITIGGWLRKLVSHLLFTARAEPVLPVRETSPNSRGPDVSAPSQLHEKPAISEKTMHLLLCVDRGSYKTVLKQESLERIVEDRDLFLFLRSTYFGRWRPRPWYSLRGLKSLSLARFALDSSNFAEVHTHSSVCQLAGCVCLPPVGMVETEYSCDPAPKQKPKIIPPISMKRLTHYIDCPAGIDSGQRTILTQLPKRTCGKLCASGGEECIGWGLHFEEGWDSRKVYIAALMAFVAGLVFGIVWAVKTKDIQSAFAVAQFIVTIACLLLGYIAIWHQ